ncbi:MULTISPECIES: hypothetical protein [unclassified Mesorhizobium]|uniref:hypothetical protein n=1 Tax=unclassified Mesorhizobium TaxID=325217 RepID=UPI0011275F94|nr:MULTISPECIES: hypothetical protein [unclassified Mesorhizobium]TPN47654.1 hypothetical protein FJ978_22375 [Mesorhizobium sp. B1-1-7]TPN58481.1 hypothetical protein FJ976_00755 [Mesorhizobium sp. B1-1-9]
MGKKHIVIAVHGIRDFGQWQDRLGDILAVNPSIVTERYRFGYFSVLAFLIPFARWLAVRAFRRHFEQLVKDNPEAHFSLVAHSFGTHIVAHAIRGMKPPDIPRIKTIILAASVLRSSFDWSAVIARSRMNGKGIQRVLNDCGWDDKVLILSQLFVLFTGMAGRVGFYGFIGVDVKNRFFPGGHGHYFKPAGVDADAFMREWWLPVLAATAKPRDGLPFPPNTIPKGIFYALLRLADPVKICVYLMTFLLVWNIAYLEPRRAAAEESYRRQYQTAATQMQSDRSVPTAFLALLRLAHSQSESDPAHILARFAGQRLNSFDKASRSLRTDTVYEWGDGSYLIRDQPIRLSVRRPIVEYHSTDFHLFILVGEGRSVWVIDDRTGKVKWKTSIDEEGYDASNVHMWRLKGSSHVAVDFDVAQPEEDNTPHYVIDVNLDGGDGTYFGGHPAAGLDCATIEPALELPDNDDDDPTPEQYKTAQAKLDEQTARTKTCLLPLSIEVPPSFRFPAVSSESNVWSSVASTPVPKDDTSTSGCAYGEMLFTHDRRENGKLRFDDSTTDDPSVNDLSFNNGDCFYTFQGPGAKHYIALSKVMGKAWVEWLICELRTEVDVGRCVEDGFYYLAKGDLSMSPNRRYLALADDASEGIGNSWSLIDLQNMVVLAPTVFPLTRVSAVAMTDEAVLVAAPAAAPRGALELWAYKFTDGIPELLTRQLIQPPESFEFTGDSDTNIHDATRLIVSSGSFVLASIFQEIADLKISSDTSMLAWAGSVLPWLVPPAQPPLATLWTTPEVGLPVNVQIAITYSPDREILAVSAASQIRIVNTSDGTFLTPVIDISTFPACRGPIVAVTAHADLTLTVTTDNCVATRQSPLSATELAKIEANPSLYFGMGGALAPMLPNETRAP